MEMSEQMQKYFKDIEEQTKKCYALADEARKKNIDSVNKVSILLARNLSERVEGLIAVLTPQIKGSGVSDRIKELEKEYGNQDWRVALVIAKEVAQEKFCKFKDKKEAMETGIRVGFAYATVGVVSSPLEGFIGLDFRKRKDGKDYVVAKYAGPIRSAGGTGASVSVIIVDYVRKEMGYENYDPTQEEIKRTSAEVHFFHERCTNLQYLPSERELEFLTEHLTIQIDGDASEKIETPMYKDLQRIPSNLMRNGFCLVMAECLSLKAPKLWKKLSAWKDSFGLNHWEFLEKFIKIQKEVKAQGKGKVAKISEDKVSPDYTYIKDIVAGRPIFGYPLGHGTFRLRYGRARTSGFSSDAISPITQIVLDNFLAIGTQLKTERPGKSTVLTTCDVLEGPIVKLKNGNVVKPETIQDAKTILNDIVEIIYLGDILVNYGDMLNRAHMLLPPGYCEEFWALDFEKKLSDVEKEMYKEILENPMTTKVSFEESYKICKSYDMFLHPKYTYHWNAINYAELIVLIEWLKHSVIKPNKIILPIIYDLKKEIESSDPKRALELLGVPHQVANNEYVVIDDEWANALAVTLGFYSKKFDYDSIIKLLNKDKKTLENIGVISEVKLRDKSGYFIGSRMGRPEKAKIRKMTGSPHSLFPVGEEGGRMRAFNAAIEKNKITAEYEIFLCKKCNRKVVYRECPYCSSQCIELYKCSTCGIIEKECNHERLTKYEKIELPINEYLSCALKKLGLRNYPELIKGVRGTSNKNHFAERLEKGILRSIHNIYVNKDGTTRYDMTELAITHFKPKETGTSIEKLKEMGYTKDIKGNDLINDEQILELKCQDLILPACPDSFEEGADNILFRVSKFIDDELEKLYGIPRFYNLKEKKDLVGHLVIGLSPHTAAGIVCRIIGFSKTQGMFAHPLLHSIMRRDCVHPKTKLLFFDASDNLNYEKIGKFVDDLIEKGAKTRIIDMVGTRAVYPKESYYTYGADPKTKGLVKKKIKHFIKGPIDKKWIKITTATNRKFVMTVNHDFLYLDKDNNIKSKKAKDINIGDKTLVMDYLDFPKKNEEKIDLIEELIKKLPANIKPKICVFDCETYFRNLVRNIGREKIISILQLNNTLRRNIGRWYKAVPLNHLEILISSGLVTYGGLPKESKLKYWFSNEKFNRFLCITPEFCRLLGTYAAEGHCRENKTTRQVSFRICNPILGESNFNIIKKVFGIWPALEENNTKITISHAIIYYLFKYILETGSNAFNKKVPRLVYSLSNYNVLEYLSGYIDGDGGVVPERGAVVFYSANRSLLDDLALLITRFHIIARYQTSKERLPGKTLLLRYKELNRTPKMSVGHNLVFNGVDAVNLSNKLNLIHPEKIIKQNYISNSQVESRLLKFDHHYYPLLSFGDSFVDFIKNVEVIEDEVNSYCVEVEWDQEEEKNVVWGEQIVNFRCDGDEACCLLLMDAFLNFSNELLSSQRGATQDEPLVLTYNLIPAEVDDMVFDIDTAWKYPLEFYEAALEYKNPADVKIEIYKNRLGKPEQFEGLGFTHDTTDFNIGVKCSSYKTIPTMKDKVRGQMKIAEKLRAVDENDVARLVIDRHFIRDIKGNLRKFSQQEFRCIHCNEKYRRPPLRGICLKCNGRIVFTISEGSIIKYLEPCLDLGNKYILPPYLKQVLELTKQRIEMVFGKEKEKQEALGKWFG